MVHLDTVEQQLRDIGFTFRFFSKPEVRELANILTPDETVHEAVNGYYENGFALLCVTNHRLLLIDRKPMFLTLEDIRFDMVSEVDFNFRLLNATARVYTPNKSLVFTSWNHKRLRQLTEHLQERVMHSRQHTMAPQQQFAQYAQTQIAEPTPAPSIKQRTATALIPALAKTALEGSKDRSIPIESPMAGHRFISPLSRNPYTKTPLLSRRRKFPNF